jgi:pantetheine-phosphate adenylyltransferase
MSEVMNLLFKNEIIVNSERDMRGYPPLELRIIDVISSENTSVQGKDMDVLKISSSWIREYISSSNNK